MPEINECIRCGSVSDMNYNKLAVCKECYNEFNELLGGQENALTEAKKYFDIKYLRAISLHYTNIPPIPEFSAKDWNEINTKN